MCLLLNVSQIQLILFDKLGYSLLQETGLLGTIPFLRSLFLLDRRCFNEGDIIKGRVFT